MIPKIKASTGKKWSRKGGSREANGVENAVRVAMADSPAPCPLNSAGELMVEHGVDVVFSHALDSLHQERPLDEGEE